MNAKMITVSSAVILIVMLVLWDLYVHSQDMHGEMISDITGAYFKTTPVLAMALGVIVGHLASEFPGTQDTLKWISERPLVPLIYGSVGGFLFWNMGR